MMTRGHVCSLLDYCTVQFLRCNSIRYQIQLWQISKNDMTCSIHIYFALQIVFKIGMHNEKTR